MYVIINTYICQNKITIDMESHRITYEGVDFEVFGNFQEAEENYKGGWSTELIKVNDVDIYWMLKTKVIERITEIVTEENY